VKQNPAIKKLLEQFSFFTIAEGLEALVPFILLPLLTNILSPEEYGLWVIYVAVHTLARPILGLCLNDAIRLDFFKLPKDGLSGLLAAAFLYTLAAVAIASVGTVLLFDYISQILCLPMLGVLAGLLTAALQGLFYLMLAVFQFQVNPRRYLYSMLAYSSASISISTILLFTFGSWYAAVIARIIGLALGIGFALLELHKAIPFNLCFWTGPAPVSRFLALGIRYLPAGISPLIVPFATRMIVAKFVSVSEVAMFGIAMLFSSVMLLIGNAVRLSIQPRLFAAVHRGDVHELKTLGRCLIASFIFMIAICLGIIFISPIIFPLLVGDGFAGAIQYIPYLCIAALTQCLFDYCQVILQSLGKVTFISVGNTLLILLAIFLQLLFVRYMGGLGVAYATAAAYGIISLPSFVVIFHYTRNFK
jgi:O-antigen/teichoic acid export membrane protein